MTNEEAFAAVLPHVVTGAAGGAALKNSRAPLDYRCENVLQLRPDFHIAREAQPKPDDATVRLVAKLRLLLQQSLLQPRCDWDKAFMLVTADPNAPMERYATVFFHGLEVHGARHFQFFASRSVEMSGDEMWMAQLVSQLQGGDTENARYLIAIRVRHAGRRRLLVLAEGLARGLTKS